jgi:hypothetical protein
MIPRVVGQELDACFRDNDCVGCQAVMMMITFGVSFRNVVMGRIFLFLGVLETVYGKWLGLLR